MVRYISGSLCRRSWQEEGQSQFDAHTSLATSELGRGAETSHATI
jgi:hypothetical protein